MNVGEKVDVLIGGSVVAQAEVKEVGDGTATLIVPATRVVMAVRTELAPEVGPDNSSGTQTIIDEVVRTPVENAGDAAPVEQNSVTSAAPDTSEQSKVITSSSVPKPNEPNVEAITAAVVAALAAQQAESSVEPEATDDGTSQQD